MKTDYSLTLQEKVDLQDKLLQNFEEEKTQLLKTIESLSSEKEIDKQINNKSIELAKNLIETMGKQIELLKNEIDGVQKLKSEYKKYIEIVRGLKDEYKQILIDFSNTIKETGECKKNRRFFKSRK